MYIYLFNVSLWKNVHNMKLALLAILSVKARNIKYIHAVVQPTLLLTFKKINNHMP